MYKNVGLLGGCSGGIILLCSENKAAIVLNLAPWSGLVNKSAIISSVGKYFTETSPAATWSVIRKYQIPIYRVILLLYLNPLFYIKLEIWLCCYTMERAFIKLQVRSTSGSTSLTPKILDSVDLFVLNLCCTDDAYMHIIYYEYSLDFLFVNTSVLIMV